MMRSLSPLARRRLERFRSNGRGWWSDRKSVV